MNQKYEKLKALLKELFQLDQPDLDFGLYRIMHAKSAEVTQFLDKDLLPQVKQAFGLYKTADKSELEKELAEAIKQAQALGADPETLPKVKELRARIASDAVDLGGLENEVYDHLFTFFRRYYSEGDFIAKRVYKPGVYAIPYEGEEVTFQWANRDQYYIKTSEYLRDYAFRLRPEDNKKPMRVHFRLTDATEGEHGNVKAVDGNDRVFILVAPGESGRDFIAEKDGDLAILFEYRPALLNDWPDHARAGNKPPAQKDLIALATSRVLAVADASLIPWIAELGKLHVTASGEPTEYSRLEAHLRRYTARNTFDYFIHKDLDGFLRRELDFYIKNEVMQLDDVENETAPRVEQYLSKIKVIRQIASKLIGFLAQLEDFEKNLWLKKKFVVETRYCIRLAAISEEFYPEIAANNPQREEWVRLLAIDELKGDLSRPDYSAPLSVDFLKAHPTLVLDTKHFSPDFAESVLNSISNLDAKTDGLLICGDNFQALSLIRKRFRDQVRCIYIDPPYNTGGDGFAFKDNYRHSSWISMMWDRLHLARDLMADDGVLYASIDANERNALEFICGDVFGDGNRVEELIWVQNATKNQSPTYSTSHEYVEVFAKKMDVIKRNPLAFREPKPGYAEVRALVERLNEHFPPIREVEGHLRNLFTNNKKKSSPTLSTESSQTADEHPDEWKGLYNYTRAEYRDDLGHWVREEEAQRVNARLWIWREDNPSMPQVKEDSQNPRFRDSQDPAFRFYKPIHPITGQPCPHPKTGWRWPYAPLGNQVNSFSTLAADHRIAWGDDETKIPQTKRFLHEVETNVAKSVVSDFTDGEKELARLFGQSRVFSNPKPSTLPLRFCRHVPSPEAYVLDFFAGSGTTGHAVIELNRQSGGRRRFMLVEAGEHFSTVLLPRIKKLTFTPEWSEGKPRRLATQEEADSSPHVVKVICLESYEDALKNLELGRSTAQRDLLESSEAAQPGGLMEQYFLRYMLNVDTRGSQSLLNVQAFQDPTAYKLKVKRPDSDESREINVDLLETFNWLIGLTVQHIAAPQSFNAFFERDSEKRLRLKGRIRQGGAGPWWFRTVTGTTPDGRRTLVIWRKLTGVPEQDNLVLDEWFTKQGYSTKDFEFQLVYVNGDNNLENLKAPDDTWKVRLIEEDFHRRMFDAEGM